MKNNYINNRQNIVKKLKDASYIFIAGNGLVSRSGDTAYKFRQDSNMLYLTGVNEPGVSLVIDVKNNNDYLVLPNINKIEEIFGGKPDCKKLMATSGVNNCITEQEALELLKTAKNIYYNVSPKAFSYSVYANPNRARWYKRLNRAKIKTKDVRPALAELRMIKQPYEVKNIKKAISITKEVLQNVQQQLGAFKTEDDIVNYITAEFSLQGVQHAYQPIVASGANAATLHYLGSDDALYKDDLLLFDVGAEYNGYSADISRTFVNGNNPKLQKIINDVTAVQSNIIKSLKPGVTFRELQNDTRDQLSELVVKYSLGKKTDIDSLFPTAVGHHLGLDTHDAGFYNKPIQENMVVTVEPGLYSKKLGFGVRLEDDILITTKGSEIL